MKNIFSLLAICIVLIISSCTGGAGNGDTAPVNIPAGMMEVDLSEYGFNIMAVIPDSTIGVSDIAATGGGEATMVVGKNFQVQISLAQPGDFEQLKTDLNDDLLYKSSFIKEEPQAVVYKSDLPDGSKSFFHFYMIKEIGGTNYVIRDIDSGEDYPQAAVEKMFETAKLFRAKPKAA